MDRQHGDRLDRHYPRQNLTAAMPEGLRAAGKDHDALAVEHLAPLDQVHTLGPAATRELMEPAGVGGGLRVWDVGGGLGGPARQRAAATGCTDTVPGITAAPTQAGGALTARTGLANRVTFQRGDATVMPFPDAGFDLVWLQQSTINIADKATLVREVHRMLVPGGRVALHVIMAGPSEPPRFPAGRPPTPHAASCCRRRRYAPSFARAGSEMAWEDTTPRVPRVFAPLATDPPPPLSSALVFGTDDTEVFGSSMRTIVEGRVAA